MNTQLIREFFLEPDKSGIKITAFCFIFSGIVGMIAGGIFGILRLAEGNYFSGIAYLIMFLTSQILIFYSLNKISIGKPEKLLSLSFPVVIIGFIFGLTALFFIDGGMNGGVPVFFILAVTMTPCLLNVKDALIILFLEISAYVTNIIFEFFYPDSILFRTSHGLGFVFLVMAVSGTLGILCLFYNYLFRNQQQKLETAVTEANSAKEAKSAFLNSMSHEIRTPMNSILGMNEMILREEERPEIREYALVIQRSGRALLGIINDVLDFSKLQDNKMEISPVRYDLSSLINDLVSMAAEQAKKKSLIFTVNVDKEIPRILDGDEYHLRQVMMNILNNAIKYTERGGITVTIGFEKLDNYNILLKCSVSDTGIGIKPEDMEYIFLPFEHVEASRKFSADGSGLGLSIVQKLLHLMGSELKIESEFRKGSTFSFDVKQTVIKWEPIGDYERAFSMVTMRQSGKFTQTFQAPNANVLVVDDADVNLLVFANLLKKTKIKIDTASSGVEMLQMVRMKHYDMIFLDHRMPGMDGIEAFHNMKKDVEGLNYNTPVVALTANAVLGARQLYIDEGFSDYISKPVDTVRLEQILLEYLPKDLIIKGEEIPVEEPKNIIEQEELYEEERAVLDDDKEIESSPYKNIPGIDYDAAVTNCGTEETFVQALEIFYNTLDKKADEIENYERDKDIKNYTVKVHALKSAARLVGALELSADAKYLEECGDKNDVSEIEAKTPALLKKYRDYKDVLAKVFGSNDEEDMSLPEISKADLQELYSLIKGFAADFDLDNIDRMIEETKNFRIPESEREKFEKVKECVTNADWGSLESLL